MFISTSMVKFLPAASEDSGTRFGAARVSKRFLLPCDRPTAANAFRLRLVRVRKGLAASTHLVRQRTRSSFWLRLVRVRGHEYVKHPGNNTDNK